MNRRESVLALFALGMASAPICSLGQQMPRIWRVGYFSSGTRDVVQRMEEAFLSGMKAYGYEIGRNLIIDTRYAEGNPARYAILADELIALKPDVLVVSSTGNAVVAARRTKTIPIVLGSVADPVGDGLIHSLARPGGNVTGNSLQLVELGAKQIELTTETLPRMRRVAVLTDVRQVKHVRDRYEQIANAAAVAKGLSLDVYRVDGPESLRRVFQNLEAKRVEALLINPSPPLNALRPQICQSAGAIGLATVGFSEEWADAGALMSFGPSWKEAYRRAAYFVDRLFKGAKPSDLPVEQPSKFELVINFKTAKALGITVPPSVRLRAERVIE